jgi:hypothetical protein
MTMEQHYRATRILMFGQLAMWRRYGWLFVSWEA